MLDFSLVKKGILTISELVTGLDVDDLRSLTNEMIDVILSMIVNCQDADVTFTPYDPDAFDPFAEDVADVELAWNLGHVIVHTTASSEEAAAIATEMARGVSDRGGRSRCEIPWQSLSRIKQCRQRLEESRRIRTASLGMWPDKPYLDNLYQIWTGEEVNAIARFAMGLEHDASHLDQIAKIVEQAKQARS